MDKLPDFIIKDLWDAVSGLYLFKHLYKKTCILAPIFLRAIINIFIQAIYPNIITYLDRIFNLNFKMKLFFKTCVNFNFIYKVSGAQTPTKKLTGTMHKRMN
jgi:hypothetical protein